MRYFRNKDSYYVIKNLIIFSKYLIRTMVDKYDFCTMIIFKTLIRKVYNNTLPIYDILL